MMDDIVLNEFRSNLEKLFADNKLGKFIFIYEAEKNSSYATNYSNVYDLVSVLEIFKYNILRKTTDEYYRNKELNQGVN